MSDHTAEGETSDSESEGQTIEDEAEEMEGEMSWHEDESKEDSVLEAELTEDEDNFEDMEPTIQFTHDVEDDQPVISALPPHISKQEGNQLEVSSSPAFQSLDVVCYLFLVVTYHRDCFNNCIAILFQCDNAIST